LYNISLLQTPKNLPTAGIYLSQYQIHCR
jgi:hypothetical protein